MADLHNTRTSLSKAAHWQLQKLLYSYSGLNDVFVQLQAFQARRNNCQSTVANLITWELFLAHIP